MTEQKVKKRGWVKNAAIIFLSVLLVLTIFSSTIMNRSLPEVATQQVQRGTISPQIRGSGTVTALESFEVKSTQSRTVLSVPVKVGTQVSVGDTLILFSDAESDDLKAAQDALDALMLAYQKALIESASGEYSAEKRAVEDAQADLNEAKAKRDANVVSNEELNAAQSAVNNAEARVAACKTELHNAQTSVEIPNSLLQNDNIKDSSVVNAKNKLAATRLLYKKEIETFNSIAERQHGDIPLEQYKEYLAMYYLETWDPDGNESYYYKLGEIYYEIRDVENEYYAALRDYAVTIAENNLKKAELDLSAAEEANKKLKAKRTDYDAAVKAIGDNQWALQKAIEDLEKSVALESLDFSEMKKDIDKSREELDSLKSGGEGATVTSKVSGIVTSVGVTPGSKTTPDQTLVVVEVPDMGYTVSFPVTTAQSQRVREGDAATSVTAGGWWGRSNISANLASIRTNPENPTTSKLLVFKISGEVASGDQLTISIGERGSNYDAVVPTSAIRSDSNGSFVLVVQAKSTALGNRFKAVRVDVQILASDDTNSAVTGGIAAGDYVITHSTTPIESGMQVRLPDNN